MLAAANFLHHVFLLSHVIRNILFWLNEINRLEGKRGRCSSLKKNNNKKRNASAGPIGPWRFRHKPAGMITWSPKRVKGMISFRNCVQRIFKNFLSIGVCELLQNNRDYCVTNLRSKKQLKIWNKSNGFEITTHSRRVKKWSEKETWKKVQEVSMTRTREISHSDVIIRCHNRRCDFGY